MIKTIKSSERVHILVPTEMIPGHQALTIKEVENSPFVFMPIGRG